MTYDERIVRTTDDPAVAARHGRRAPRHPHARAAARSLGRIVIVLFGIVQVLIIMRIVLLLLNAREGNDLVSSGS